MSENEWTQVRVRKSARDIAYDISEILSEERNGSVTSIGDAINEALVVFEKIKKGEIKIYEVKES